MSSTSVRFRQNVQIISFWRQNWTKHPTWRCSVQISFDFPQNTGFQLKTPNFTRTISNSVDLDELRGRTIKEEKINELYWAFELMWTKINEIITHTLSRVLFQFTFFGRLFFVEAKNMNPLPMLRLSSYISSLTEGRRYYPSRISLQKSRLSARYVWSRLLLLILVPFVLFLFPFILLLSFECFDEGSENSGCYPYKGIAMMPL